MVLKKRRGLNQINHRTSLLVDGGIRQTKSGKERFTILSSSHERKTILKVLASNRDRVEELYRLFPELPPGEKPLDDFTCALHKEILLQGRMIVCVNCICFHSNIFGYETKVIIYLKNVVGIKREKTAYFVPNAISIVTLNKRYFFCSFLSRETVIKLLFEVWKSVYCATNPEKNDEKDVLEKNQIFTSTYDGAVTSFPPTVTSTLLPRRPHTSPPAACLSQDSSPTSPSEGESSEEQLEEDHVQQRSQSLPSRINDLSWMQQDSCMLEWSKRKDKCPNTIWKRLKLNLGISLEDARNYLLRFRLKDKVFTCIAILILTLTLVNLYMLYRIHSLSIHIEARNTAKTQPIAKYLDQDGNHETTLQSIKDALSSNADKVRQVQNALSSFGGELNCPNNKS